VPGHAYHTYRLTSPDKTVALELQHVRRAWLCAGCTPPALREGGTRAQESRRRKLSRSGCHPCAWQNVCGRAVYAEGTADAVEFLAAQVHAQHPRRVWSMLDVGPVCVEHCPVAPAAACLTRAPERVLLGAVCSEPPRSLAWPAQILKAGALA
jgi:hypothetical protein